MRQRLAAKKKKTRSPWIWASYWVLAFSLTLWMLVSLWHGDSGGVAGRHLSTLLRPLMGQSAYIFPFLLLYGLVILLLRADRPHRGAFTLMAGTAVILCSLSSILHLGKTHFIESGLNGGRLGAVCSSLFEKMFGATGAVLLSLGFLLIGTQVLFEISWKNLLKRFIRAAADDYRAWMAARRELNSRLKIISERETAEKRELKISRPETVKAEKKTADICEDEDPQDKTPEAAPAARMHRSSPEEKNAGKTPEELKKKILKNDKSPFRDFRLPGTSILNEPSASGIAGPADGEVQAASRKLEETLASFEIAAHVSAIYPGPVITRYEVTPASGVKISSIVALSNDIALAMKAMGIRVIAPIPGKSAIGFEIPNAQPATVCIREILESSSYNEKRAPLVFGIGRHTDGATAVADLEKMPHMLVAGATNSGKSVFLHAFILSLIYRNTPDELKFLMIDPKRLELTFYDWIPYLYDPKTPCEKVSVITHPKDAARSLVALTKVMDLRYAKFEKAKVKNISSYNRWAAENNEPAEFYILVVIDELADLMLQCGDVVEDAIQRLAQMARSVGIHLVLSTQRLSVDVITGVIKANLPSRVAMQVASKIDSRVILDMIGAESLLGKGDMLYLAIDAQKPVRIQGAYVSESEITRVSDFIRAQGRPWYPMPLLEEKDQTEADGKGGSPEELEQALHLIMERRRVSQDLLKAHFGSSARATNLLSVLEVRGFIHKPDGSNRWEIFFDKIEDYISGMAAREEAGAGEGQPMQ
ncbi:MAG: DNA translocase FtsK 4TM domain-containing protein [bacterium]